jgi:RecJ-like exonuclease
LITCKHCNGSGKIDIACEHASYPHYVECPDCHGTGKTKPYNVAEAVKDVKWAVEHGKGISSLPADQSLIDDLRRGRKKRRVH